MITATTVRLTTTTTETTAETATETTTLLRPLLAVALRNLVAVGLVRIATVPSIPRTATAAHLGERHRLLAQRNNIRQRHDPRLDIRKQDRHAIPIAKLTSEYHTGETTNDAPESLRIGRSDALSTELLHHER